MNKESPEFKEVEIKLNTAAILLEAKKVKQKAKEEELYLKQVEVNMRDSTEFKNWHEE